MESEDKPTDENLSFFDVKQETLEETAAYAEDQNFAYDDYELDLSEKFIKTILQQVDILCETIENGDPSLERRVEVNRNLNDSVNCYKDILISKNVKEEIVVDLQPENYKSDSEDNVLKQEFEDETFTEDNLIQDTHDDLFLVKKKRLKKRISTKGINRNKYYPYLKYNPKDSLKIFECSLCNSGYSRKNDLLGHLESKHDSEIGLKSDNCVDENPIQKYDCEARICKKLYGSKFRHFWCLQCVKSKSCQEEKSQEKRKKYESKFELCPECGKNVQGLKLHMAIVHTIDKQTCPHCKKECRNKKLLMHHIKNIHEKIPCAQCGKLVGVFKMSVHLQTHEKKFKCNFCGKGFGTNSALKDHKNIHTGERPYKCKYCSASFTSDGSHRMHEKSHLGHRRIQILEKKFKCDICGKGFTKDHFYKDHMNIHTGEKPYKCKFCSASFANYSTHRRHEKRHLGIQEKKSRKNEVTQ